MKPWRKLDGLTQIWIVLLIVCGLLPIPSMISQYGWDIASLGLGLLSASAFVLAYWIWKTN